jgi:small subunit ribosomal protein S6
MRQYELVTVFHTEDDQIKLGKDFVQSELAKQGAKVLKEDDMGDRQLAYPIQKKNRGHYFLYTIELAPDRITPIERNFLLNQGVMTFLFVRKEE